MTWTRYTEKNTTARAVLYCKPMGKRFRGYLGKKLVMEEDLDRIGAKK